MNEAFDRRVDRAMGVATTDNIDDIRAKACPGRGWMRIWEGLALSPMFRPDWYYVPTALGGRAAELDVQIAAERKFR